MLQTSILSRLSLFTYFFPVYTAVNRLGLVGLTMARSVLPPGYNYLPAFELTIILMRSLITNKSVAPDVLMSVLGLQWSLCRFPVFTGTSWQQLSTHNSLMTYY